MTQLEFNIIDLLCKDYRLKDIAKELNYSVSKIEKELFFIKDRFQVKTLNGLIAKYYENQTTKAITSKAYNESFNA
jgi:DNA-binding CsgD family transcriptional regulator